MMDTEVSIVMVSMNRMDLLRPALDSIKKCTSVSYEVLLVAYMFSEENLEALRTEYPDVKVIVSRELRGFAENNNLALRQVQGRYCFIVNDDTYMQMPVIDRLVEDMHRFEAEAGDLSETALGNGSMELRRGIASGSHSSDLHRSASGNHGPMTDRTLSANKVGTVPFPAAIQPKIVFPDGRVQTCGRRKMNAWTYLRHYFHRFNELEPTQWTMHEGLFQTYTLNGAAFLIRTDIFRKAGWFDETYTFTPEDIALGTYLNHLGCAVYCDADVQITHFANSTASRMESAIKPTRVRGALIFYSSMSRGRIKSPQGTDNVNIVLYLLLGVIVWLYEAARGVRYLFADTSDPQSHEAVMAATARNVRRSIFTHRLPKEIFVELYNGLRK